MWDLPGTRNRTLVPCIGRQVLIHCTTREVLELFYCGKLYITKHTILNTLNVQFSGTKNLIYLNIFILGFLGGSDSKESTCNAGDLSLIPGLGRSSGRGHGNPLQYFCLENPHEQRNLVGYSP